MEPGHMAIDRRGSRDRIPLDTSSSRRRAAGVWAVLAASLACLLPASAAGAAPSLHPRLARRVEPALIIAGSGTIEGTVSSSETKAPLGEVEVCAIEREVLSEGVEGEALPFEECTITDASGDYTLEVPAREYYVEFYPLPESGLDYQTQFYNGKARFFDADPVNVMAGQVTSGIDAALLSGGEISGTVTSAVTKGPVAEVLVCAFGKASESGNCAMDGPNGEYTVPGLAGGSYVVIFEPFGEEAEISYALQFYNGKAREVEADPVEAVVGENTPNIDAVLQKDVPRARSQPGVAGDAAVGQTLTVLHAAWTNSPTSIVDVWGRCDGAGKSCFVAATGPSYTVTSRDVGHTLAVRETAFDAAGESLPAFSSPTSIVPAPSGSGGAPAVPSPAPAQGILSTTSATASAAQLRSLLDRLLAPSGRGAKIGQLLEHAGYAASFNALTRGRLTIAWYLVPRGAHLASAKPVLVASGGVSLAGAGPAKLKIKLTPRGRGLLAHARRLALIAKGTLESGAGAAVRAKRSFTVRR